MGELGDEGPALHAEVGEQARRAGIEHLLTLGELSAAAAKAFGSGARHFRELDALCSALDALITPAMTVLVKGSRFMRMERVVERFAAGGSQTTQGDH
jgi:UDP-N-acetylmuramoyl-tripeptide--D-alanyl-D-alanine ligase